MYPNWSPVTLNVACQLQKAKKTEDASRQPFAVLKFCDDLQMAGRKLVRLVSQSALVGAAEVRVDCRMIH